MGGPITVTDPDVTRYFMTVEESVQLVIQAGAIGVSGEAMVLDMGKPVKIADVARRLADEADRDIEIIYTGLRPGEKLHEVLQALDEEPRRSAHALIDVVDVPPLHPAEITGLTSPNRATLLLELDDHVTLRPTRLRETTATD
jgi:FlaA1/EpsC-like NDP-sugar epimerase